MICATHLVHVGICQSLMHFFVPFRSQAACHFVAYKFCIQCTGCTFCESCTLCALYVYTTGNSTHIFCWLFCNKVWAVGVVVVPIWFWMTGPMVLDSHTEGLLRRLLGRSRQAYVLWEKRNMPAFCAAKQLLVYTHFGALSPTMAYCLRDIYLQISHHHDMTAFYI